jgi:protein gp37
VTAIEWTDATWNPTTGCDRVSPGCAHCYALTLAARLKAMGQPRYQRDGDPRTSGPGFGLTLHPDKLDQPLRWRKPRRVFVNSMSDLFHEEVPFDFLDSVFATMAHASQHTFQVLTKRPERLRAYYASFIERELSFSWPLRNVWLGTSIENDRHAYRADVLRETPAAVRFISAEPLLGPLPSLDLTGIDWVIAGGESGHGARPASEEWVRDLRDHCLRAGGMARLAEGTQRPAFFFKQWGGRTPKSHGRILDGREWSEYPAREVAAA